jgi:hypothetical protein
LLDRVTNIAKPADNALRRQTIVRH